MTFYYAAFCWYFAVVLVGVATRSLRILLLPAMAPLVVMACLRGIVGTDTVFYMSLFDLMRESDSFLILFEPLFAVIVHGLLMIVSDSHTVLLILAALATLLMVTGAFKLERQPVLFATILFPYLYLELTMNTVRLGLAVGVSIWAVFFLGQGRRLWFIVLTVIASQIHISSIMLTAGTWFLLESRIKTLLVLSVLGAIAYAVLADYIMAKFLAYTELQTEAASAGLAPMLLIIMILGAAALDERLRKDYGIQIITMFVMACCFFLLSRVTYAGLRFLANLILLVYLFTAVAAKSRDREIRDGLFIMLFMISIMATGLRMRNYAASVNDFIGAPYTPYHFVWEVRL